LSRRPLPVFCLSAAPEPGDRVRQPPLHRALMRNGVEFTIAVDRRDSLRITGSLAKARRLTLPHGHTRCAIRGSDDRHGGGLWHVGREERSIKPARLRPYSGRPSVPRFGRHAVDARRIGPGPVQMDNLPKAHTSQMCGERLLIKVAYHGLIELEMS
jgi:hypothetical protein